MKLKYLLPCFLLTLSAFASTPETREDQMLQELDVIKTILGSHYAPTDWKRTYAGWDLNQEIEKAKDCVKKHPKMSTTDFQRVLLSFFKSTKDYHVGVFFYKTSFSTLPFRVYRAQDRYFICDISSDLVHSCPMEIGDELIAFDGLPADLAVKKVMELNIGNNSQATDLSLATYYLTNRFALRGHQVKPGAVSITIKSQKSGKTESFQMMWDYFPEKVSDLACLNPPFKGHIEGKYFELPFLTQEKTLKKRSKLSESRFDIGARRSYIPTLGEVVWSTCYDNPFDAYIFLTDEGKKVGYVRIPSYHIGNSEEEYTYRTMEFAKIIALFEEQTDSLVIDQINNPGGAVCYLYALASMLTDTPLKTPLHRMSISPKEVAEAHELIELLESIHSDEQAIQVLGDRMQGYPMSYQWSRFFLEECKFIVREWNAGRTLTEPHFICGVDEINPSCEARYTKPILVIVNELCFSGGDFFPAILQDNGRIRLFGTKTAGAGGYVLEASYPNRFGIQGYRYTGSIAERVNLEPIENLGVTPDVIYEIDPEDVNEGFLGYKKAILDAIP